MRDTIAEEDMLIDLSKTEIEKRLLKTEQENKILKERLSAYEGEVRQVKDALGMYLEKLKEIQTMTKPIKYTPSNITEP